MTWKEMLKLKGPITREEFRHVIKSLRGTAEQASNHDPEHSDMLRFLNKYAIDLENRIVKLDRRVTRLEGRK